LLAGASMLETLTDPQDTEIRIGRALNTVDVAIDVTIEVLLIEVLGRCQAW
jgi:hypothetical protein